jgi:hypothetical protein
LRRFADRLCNGELKGACAVITLVSTSDCHKAHGLTPASFNR